MDIIVLCSGKMRTLNAVALFCTFHELLLKLASCNALRSVARTGKSMNKFAFAFNFIVRYGILYTIFILPFFIVISSNIITPSLNMRRIRSESFRHPACAYFCYNALSKSGRVDVHWERGLPQEQKLSVDSE